MSKVQKISPFLWFDNNAEEAVNFYTSIFENSRIKKTVRNGDGMPGPKGSVLTMSFELAGGEFTALNGGPMYRFTEAISLLVMCDDQEEVDRLWSRLTSGGGKEVQCGWLKEYPSNELSANAVNLNASLSQQYGGSDDINALMWLIK